MYGTYRKNGIVEKVRGNALPLDTWHASRAQSILHGMDFQDDSRYAPLLPFEQAVDVISWHARSGGNV